MKIDWTTGDGTKRWIGSVKCKNVKRNYTITSTLNWVGLVFYSVSKLNVLPEVGDSEHIIGCTKTKF